MAGRIDKYISHSAEETFSFGVEFGRQLPLNSIVCFYGNLGAGKTTFIKGMGAGILGISQREVVSPTFTYLNIYHSANKDATLYHFDLYRLSGLSEFLAMGFDEMFEASGICCIEWSEKIAALELKAAFHVEISYISEESREITIQQKG